MTEPFGGLQVHVSLVPISSAGTSRTVVFEGTCTLTPPGRAYAFKVEVNQAVKLPHLLNAAEAVECEVIFDFLQKWIPLEEHRFACDDTQLEDDGKYSGLPSAEMYREYGNLILSRRFE